MKVDGSGDITVSTTLPGSFNFTGEPAEHKHDIALTNVELSGDYTPAGEIKGTYQPEGSVSAPEITVSKSTQSIRSITSDASYTQGQCAFPTLSSSAVNGTVTLALSGGSYTPGSYVPPAYDMLEVMVGATATATAPTFTGTPKDINAEFAGTEATINVNGDISGTTEDKEITPAGSVEYSI